jgi:hypothetical protein
MVGALDVTSCLQTGGSVEVRNIQNVNYKLRCSSFYGVRKSMDSTKRDTRCRCRIGQ